jgi:hypothetical protein
MSFNDRLICKRQIEKDVKGNSHGLLYANPPSPPDIFLMQNNCLRAETVISWKRDAGAVRARPWCWLKKGLCDQNRKAVLFPDNIDIRI